MFTSKSTSLLIGLIFALTTVCSGQILVSGNDTVSCYTNKELRVITKAVLHGKECDTLLSICEQQMDSCDVLRKNHEEQKKLNEQLKKTYKDEIALKDYKITGLEKALEQEKRNVRKQKVFKWISIGAGAFTTGFMTYLWVMKP